METMCRLAWIAALSAVLSGCALPAPRLSEPDNSCGAVVEEGIAQTITAQIDALEKGDFDAAYAMASQQFQSQFSEEAFQGVISGGFAFLMEPVSVVFSDCIFDSETTSAQTRVTVTTVSGEGWTLMYQLAKSEEGWRIEGAALTGSAAANT